MSRRIEDLAAQLWTLIGGARPLGPLTITGDRQVLPSVFDVTGLATASVGVATAAVAELAAARADDAVPVARVDTRSASAAFVGELLFTPVGWDRPAIFDPVAGDYRAADGWIRLHTNYVDHRAAALDALGLPDVDTTDRGSVAAAVAGRSAAELEGAVVTRGGAAAAMYDAATWRTLPHGAATAEEPAVRIASAAAAAGDPGWASRPAPRPLTGVRVLDLTRVIAGPVCTRFLAAHGADVLRLDPPGFTEVAAVVPVVTPGKRCASLDLSRPDGRARFLDLVADADVVVHGLRPGAMERLCCGPAELRAANPGVVTARLDAYGWTGPWAGRRGFDSLVQMSCGIAAAGSAAAGVDRPVPLPAQALDHGTGYLLAAAVARALTVRLTTGRATDVTASLLGTANVVVALPVPGGLEAPRPDLGASDLVDSTTSWGAAQVVPSAGSIDGHPASYAVAAGPLGRDAPAWW
jgi:hypothetical protein